MIFLGAFQLYDLDEDGVISRAEMFCIVDAIYRMMGNMVELDSDEATPEMRVDKVFTLMDKVLCFKTKMT